MENNETDREDESEELEGAVGGTVQERVLPSPQLSIDSQESQNGEDSKTSLLDELQEEIDRLHLLSSQGQFNNFCEVEVRCSRSVPPYPNSSLLDHPCSHKCTQPSHEPHTCTHITTGHG